MVAAAIDARMRATRRRRAARRAPARALACCGVGRRRGARGSARAFMAGIAASQPGSQLGRRSESPESPTLSQLSGAAEAALALGADLARYELHRPPANDAPRRGA